jgi:hypothetical protein
MNPANPIYYDGSNRNDGSEKTFSDLNLSPCPNCGKQKDAISKDCLSCQIDELTKNYKKISEENKQEETSQKYYQQVGWLCGRCGRSNSPSLDSCFCSFSLGTEVVD